MSMRQDSLEGAVARTGTLNAQLARQEKRAAQLG
jgi:hypothetical protein